MTPAPFVKVAAAGDAARFAMEAEGLAALAATGAVRVPRVLDHGVRDGQAFIELERLTLARPDAGAGATLGRQLAALHKHFGVTHGWAHDGFLGLAAQPNGFDDDWPRFFARNRLGVMLDRAEANGYAGRITRRGRQLVERLPELLDHRPRPSLLHGDLWHGNHGMLPDRTPVVFDPAVHYGDRECDLAMASLFGGFQPAFFDAYIEAWPLLPGWQQRWKVYQLYHVLNHLNLFGEQYLMQADALLNEM